jgi:biotin carboxyl carrier protein
VLSVKVKPGDTVAMNDTLLVLEAMKMESNVASPTAGTVSEVLVSQGDAVTAGQVLVKFG